MGEGDEVLKLSPLGLRVYSSLVSQCHMVEEGIGLTCEYITHFPANEKCLQATVLTF